MNNYIPKDGDIFQMGNGRVLSFKKLVLTITSTGFRFGGINGFPDLRGGDGWSSEFLSIEDMVKAHTFDFIRVIKDDGTFIYLKGQEPQPSRKRVVRD